jgi:hypothetical protein
MNKKQQQQRKKGKLHQNPLVNTQVTEYFFALFWNFSLI